MSVPDRLKSAAALFESRNNEYSNAFTEFGDVLKALFPSGLMLSDPEDFGRFALLLQCAGKLKRYSNNFHHGGHKDSLDDLAAYAMMLQELDHQTERKRIETERKK